MQMPKLEWDGNTVIQYGVDVVVGDTTQLEIPLYQKAGVSPRPGGIALQQYPSYIQRTLDTIHFEQAREIQHFSQEEQTVFGSLLIPVLRLNDLTADPYQGLCNTIHSIGKPYSNWGMADYFVFTDMLESLGLGASNCEVTRQPSVGMPSKACLIYDSREILTMVGVMDKNNVLTIMEPTDFFGLAHCLDGVPLHTEKVFLQHCASLTTAMRRVAQR